MAPDAKDDQQRGYHGSIYDLLAQQPVADLRRAKAG
jgi:hypothetical protein